MKWYEITLFTTQDGLEAVAARFDMLGVPQVEIVESRESIEQFLQSVAKYWDYADVDALLSSKEPCVKAYLAELPENAVALEAIQNSFSELQGEDIGLDLGSLRTVITLRDEEDWANQWKLYYKQQKIGERLLICPSWEKAEDDGRTVLYIDPGMAFGTGTHHTTRMCLQYLDDIVKKGDRMLDVGCGSGILSIAALLLGAKEAVALDVDPMAERIARENAELNHIPANIYTVMAGDILSDSAMQERIACQKYDVITANIVANVIIALCPLIPPLLADDGIFISSGIISERLEEVKAALAESGFDILDITRSEDWCAIKAKKA